MFLNPVRPDSEVDVVGTVLEADDDLSILRISTKLTGPGGEPVYVEGKAEVLIRPDINATSEKKTLNT
jgi:hypothetical protein